MIPFQKITVALLLSLTSATGMHRTRAPRWRARELEASSVSTSDSEVATALLSEHRLPPVLLTAPGFYGTLAAVRTFGRAAIPVTVAGPTGWNVSTFSKYAGDTLIAPDTAEGERLVEWLEEFGRTHERHVLLPTCDDTAWLYARHRERLSKHFHVYTPSIEAVHALLHKGRLAEHARAVGLEAPQSWPLPSVEALEEFIRGAEFPVLIKPTTQALFPARYKGRVTHNAEELRAAYAELVALDHAPDLAAYDPTAVQPLVQEFFADASEGIYNISGFVRGGKLWGARASVKVLQRPRLVGVGVCFEEAELDLALCAGLERLAQRVGYSGVFEAEFVRSKGRQLLIDFNPRFYNQMGFDVARDLPLPLLAYAEAFRKPTGLRGWSNPPPDKATGTEPSGRVFVYTSAFKVMVLSQRFSGALSKKEADSWLRWYESGYDKHVDAVNDPDDTGPSFLDTMRMVQHGLRHPFSFVRSIVFNR